MLLLAATSESCFVFPAARKSGRRQRNSPREALEEEEATGSDPWIQGSSDAAAGKFKCSECGLRLANAQSYRLHLRTHNYHRQLYTCTLCGKMYNYPRTLQEHIDAVHKGKMHKCTECGKEYQTKRSFEEHMRKHSGEFEFKCDICGQEYVSKRIGIEHRNRHYGLKAYECGLCGKKYSDPFVLNRHLKECGQEVYNTHKCPHDGCDKWFKNEQYVRNHIARVHNRKNSAYALCNQCGKWLSSKGNLKSHLRSMHGIEDASDV